MPRKLGVSSMRIGARLKDERTRIGYTHAEMGAAAGVSRNAAAAWEKGTAIPSTSLALLAEVSFDVQYVLTGIYSNNAYEAARNASNDSRPITTVDEWETLRIYRELDVSQRAQARAMLQVLRGHGDLLSKPKTGAARVGMHVTADRGSIATGGDMNIGRKSGRRGK